MKKLLLLFIPLALFFSCIPEEDSSGYNCTPDGCFADPAEAQYATLQDCQISCQNGYVYDDGGGGSGSDNDWWWNVTINGNTYAGAGTNEDCSSTNVTPQNNSSGYASLSNGMLSVTMGTGDITSENYIEGGYIGITVGVYTPYEGLNEAYISPYTLAGGNEFLEYFPAGPSYVYYGIAGEEGATYYDYITGNMTPCPINYMYYSCIEMNISSLGLTDCGQNVEGDLSTTLYALDPNSDGVEGVGYDDTFSIPIDIDISFSLNRPGPYY